MSSQWPASASSIELSTTSNTRWCRPVPSEVSPMYMPGRLRTASSPSRIWMRAFAISGGRIGADRDGKAFGRGQGLLASRTVFGVVLRGLGNRSWRLFQLRRRYSSGSPSKRGQRALGPLCSISVVRRQIRIGITTYLKPGCSGTVTKAPSCWRPAARASPSLDAHVGQRVHQVGHVEADLDRVAAVVDLESLPWLLPARRCSMQFSTRPGSMLTPHALELVARSGSPRAAGWPAAARGRA